MNAVATSIIIMPRKQGQFCHKALCLCHPLRESLFLPWFWCSSLFGPLPWCTRMVWLETAELETAQTYAFVVENVWQIRDIPLKREHPLLLPQCDNRKEEA